METAWNVIQYVLTLNVRGDWVISVYLGQYHGCWCPGSLRRQDISSHDIDYIEYLGPSLAWGSILSTRVISMWRNDTKCKYMFMFSLKNLARKGLILHCFRQQLHASRQQVITKMNVDPDLSHQFWGIKISTSGAETRKFQRSSQYHDCWCLGSL